MKIVLLKTGALGDVLRTTSILPGLHALAPDTSVTWITAYGAEDLVRMHPLVGAVESVDPSNEEQLKDLAQRWAGRFDRVLSFDDELPLCRLATELAAGKPGSISGAFLDDDGRATYTDDVAPWFEMGLLSKLGKEEADRLKLTNQLSHAAIYAGMLGIEPGEPELFLPPETIANAQAFIGEQELRGRGPLIGLNTGAGGRWESKRLPVHRVAEVALALHEKLGGDATFVLLGGAGEVERNAAIRGAIDGHVRLVDAGNDWSLLEFAGLIDQLDLLITSDSLALHVAVSRSTPLVAFFAPTSAAEIDLFGRGEKVASTAPDYCSYRSDADTSTLTTERLVAASMRVLDGNAPS